MKIKISLEIKRDDIECLLDCSSRGARYWCENNLQFESETKRATSLKGEVKIIEFDDDDKRTKHILNLDKIKEGLKIMAENYPNHFADFMSEDYDDITGDVFLQCCLLKDVRYS